MLKLAAYGMDLARSFGCGQAFRWQKEDGQGDRWRGVVKDRCVTAYMEGDELILDRPKEEWRDWIHYFSLDKDYAELERLLQKNPRSCHCLASSAGIRLLRQDPFETTISFIVSANNNVKRISGILERLAERYGLKGKDRQGRTYASFPRPGDLAEAKEEELRDLGAGYRAGYIKGAAQMVADGFNLENIRNQTSDEAMRMLRTLPGVGPKVASCIMLFSLGFETACPLDVWMKRVVKELYGSLGEKEAVMEMERTFGSWTGAAQQYLFHHARVHS